MSCSRRLRLEQPFDAAIRTLIAVKLSGTLFPDWQPAIYTSITDKEDFLNADKNLRIFYRNFPMLKLQA